jgi:hypothetical protein
MRPARRAARHDGWPAILQVAVRAEFDVESYAPGPDDPILGRSPCRVPGCEGLAYARGICHQHHGAWINQGKPDVGVFVATASPARRRARRHNDVFDLSGLKDTAHLELGYVLQCRHDERASTMAPRVLSSLAGLLRRSGARSLLDRPLDEWLVELSASVPLSSFHERALLRYAYARLEDLAAVGDPEVLYARDVWDARRFGIERHRAPHRISFRRIEPRWLRDATKRWARFRLATGTRFSTISGDVGAIRRFSDSLRRGGLRR